MKSKLSTKKVKQSKIKSSEEEYLKHLIVQSQKQIDGKSEEIDNLFKEQVKRLEEELKKIISLK